MKAKEMRDYLDTFDPEADVCGSCGYPQQNKI